MVTSFQNKQHTTLLGSCKLRLGYNICWEYSCAAVILIKMQILRELRLETNKSQPTRNSILDNGIALFKFLLLRDETLDYGFSPKFY